MDLAVAALQRAVTIVDKLIDEEETSREPGTEKAVRQNDPCLSPGDCRRRLRHLRATGRHAKADTDMDGITQHRCTALEGAFKGHGELRSLQKAQNSLFGSRRDTLSALRVERGRVHLPGSSTTGSAKGN